MTTNGAPLDPAWPQDHASVDTFRKFRKNLEKIWKKPDFYEQMLRGHELSYRIPCTIPLATCGVPLGSSGFATGSYLNLGPLCTMVHIWKEGWNAHWFMFEFCANFVMHYGSYLNLKHIDLCTVVLWIWPINYASIFYFKKSLAAVGRSRRSIS